MKRIFPVLLTLALTPLVACATHEATAPADAQIVPASMDTTITDTPRRSADGHSKGAFFTKYDVDGDGHVTQAEFTAERAKGYRRRDADGDGYVQSEEYVSEYEIRLIEQLEDQRKRQIDQADFRFTVLDKDEDGNLSLDEFHASGERMFSTLDSNRDGIVDELDSKDNY
jgi:hypothetical protein